MMKKKSYHSCCLCNSTDFDLITTNISFGVDILKCSKCKLIQSEYVSDEALHDYYSDYYRGNLSETDILELRKLSRAQAVSQMDYLNSILPDMHFDNVLEIGGGLGEFAKILAESHENVYVTEADPQYVEHLKHERNLNYIEGCELEHNQYSQFFDFVVLSHVLEHLPNPIALLNDISRVVKKGGYMFVELPNESEMLVNHNFQGKGHLYFFTIGTFNALLACQGSFDLIEIRTCNRSIQDYAASNFTLADDFSLKYSPNGTMIRALLINKRPRAASVDSAADKVDHRRLADEYSRRIMHLHQEVSILKIQMNALQNKCKSAIAEAERIVAHTVATYRNRLKNHAG